MPADKPLLVYVDSEAKELVIKIGIDTLATAFMESEANNPWIDDLNDYRKTCEIVDAEVFATDVVNELENEAEDGSTPLIFLLEKMCEEASGNGSLGVDEVHSGDDDGEPVL